MTVEFEQCMSWRSQQTNVHHSGLTLFGTIRHPIPLFEKWRVQYKLALPAKENIILDILHGPKPDMVDLPLEPIYEEIIMGSSTQSEREKKGRNDQQKMNWQNKCQRLVEIGIMFGDKPWSLADRKTVSLLQLEHWGGRTSPPDL